MNGLIFFFLIVALGLGGMLAVIGGIVALLMRRRPDYGSVAALEAFDRRVAGWAASGRLGADQAGEVRALIAADRAELLGWAPPPPKPLAETAAAPQTEPRLRDPGGRIDEPQIAAPEPPAPAPAPLREPLASPAPLSPSDATAMPVAANAAPRPAAPALPLGSAPSLTLPDPGPQPAAPAPRRQLGSALMALATRRTLLFLGSFLLAVSALTLVVFNWASFPPLLQFGLLAAIVSGLWAGGAWMARRPDLATAGRNLEAVAALLVPVVVFALTRPGLLDLAPRPSWLTVSLLSLPVYLVAAWRSGRGFYSFSAAIAGASLALAAQFGARAEWMAAPLIPLLIGYLLLAHRLRPRLPALAAGPYWVAHIALPTAALSELLFGVAGIAGSPAMAVVLGLAALYYMVAAWLDQRAIWATLAALLLPVAACLSIDAAGLSWQIWPPVLAALALAYLAAGVALEVDRLPLARPVLLVAPLMAGAALLAALVDVEVARTTLPLLAIFGAALVALVERGRLAWAGPWLYGLSTGGLALAALLLPGWIVAMLDITELSLGARGLILSPLAAAYFAGAYWWPGRVRRSYDNVLQAAGALVAVAAGAATLLDEGTWVPGAVALALVWGFQATLRRGGLWAALSLGSALMAGYLALFRAPELSSTWWIWAGVGYVAAYAIGGSLLRKGGLRHWTGPALIWATFAGLLTLLLAGWQILWHGGAAPAESLAILSLAGTLALMTWIWRRGWPGYPAAALLIAGLMLAAHSGFYTGWEPAAGDLALVACALAGVLGLLGQGLRARASRAYALPYEQAGLALLTAAPLLAGSDPAHLSLTWLSMALLYGAATWRHNMPWLLAAAYISLDIGLLHGSVWLLPGGAPEGASLLLLAAVAAQSLAALWLRRSVTSLLLGAHRLPGAPSYTAALIGGAGALLLASISDPHLAGVALGLAALLGVVATGERSIPATWGALALLAFGLGALHRALGLEVMPSLAWGIGEALAIYVAGWAIAGRPGQRWQIWRASLRALPAAGGLFCGLALAALALGQSSYGYAAIGLGGLGLLLALAARREGQPWLYTAALGSWDLAILSAARWLVPGLDGSQLAPLMVVAAAAQAAGAIWLRRPAAADTRWAEAALPLYAAAGISGALALGMAFGDNQALSVAALALALIAGASAWFERREDIAWLSVGLAAVAALVIPGAIGATGAWAEAWVIIELLAVVTIGWGLERLSGAHWRRPSSYGPLIVAGLALLSVASRASFTAYLPPLTFALASMGLLLATLAVRLRSIGYGYAAGAALVAAGMCQLADWGVREVQGYVLPAGIYLLALADGLRRFQGRRKVSQVIEAGAAMLMLGATFGEAIRDGGALQGLLLCGEALAVAAYGVLLRLRVPFLAGVSFFVAGVLWMTVDNVQITNQWVLFGAIGLLMIAAYVLLERHQERLLRAGRAWAAELRGWG